MNSKLIGGILLIAGTTIGAGMLALPISTGLGGFFPAVLYFLLFWIYMTFTGLLTLEANMWMKGDVNLISIARSTLGPIGQGFAWVIYLFLLYSLTTAYMAGGCPLIVSGLNAITGYHFSDWVGAIPLLLIFGYFVYKGTQYVDHANRLLMLGLVITYAIVVVTLSPHPQTSLLLNMNWKYSLLGVSVIATSWGYHIIIPSLVHYMDRDVKNLRLSIIIGSFIPLFVYGLWELLSLGILPVEGPNGLIQGFVKGENGATLLASVLGSPLFIILMRIFSFFAIVTSFLGVSLSLSHFLADGLNIKKTPSGRAILYALTFFPPLLMTLVDPRAFLTALEYAGAFGVVTLLGLLPALMVWAGRYRHFYSSTEYRAPGGKAALLFTMGLSVAVIFLEIAIKLHWIEFPLLTKG